jgi:hypothetical protein
LTIFPGETGEVRESAMERAPDASSRVVRAFFASDRFSTRNGAFPRARRDLRGRNLA